jgi:hypothetical protein
MIGFVTKNKKAIVCQLKCWQGRTVLLYRSTLIGHVIRLHLESAFVVEELKRKFNQPMCVVKNDITTNGQPFLLVSVEIQKRLPKMVGKPHFIKTFYGVDALPPGPYEWERKS